MPGTAGVFRTDNLGLTALLHLNGYEYRLTLERRRSHGSKATWLFEEVDEYLLKLREDYVDGVSQVEPRGYFGCYQQIKEELVAALRRVDGPKEDRGQDAA